MTYPLRRKLQITVRGRITPLRMAVDFPRRWLIRLTITLLAISWTPATFAQGQVASANPVAPPPSYFYVPDGPPFPTEQPLPPEIQRILAQNIGRGKDDDLDFPFSVDKPGPEKQFRRESEKAVKLEIIQEGRRKPGSPRIFFPDEGPPSREVFQPRHFPPVMEVVEPNFVMHGRLYFEQPNSERHGWDLGILQPAVSLATFYKDTVFFPYHYWTRPGERCETSAGKCLPGDPTPFYLYRPELSWTGLLGETATVVGGIFLLH
jgi:hypothetical protein